MKKVTLTKVLVLILGLTSMLALKGPTKPIDGPHQSFAKVIDGPHRVGTMNIDGPHRRIAKVIDGPHRNGGDVAIS